MVNVEGLVGGNHLSKIPGENGSLEGLKTLRAYTKEDSDNGLSIGLRISGTSEVGEIHYSIGTLSLPKAKRPLCSFSYIASARY